MRKKLAGLALFFCLFSTANIWSSDGDTTKKNTVAPEYSISIIEGVNTAASDFGAVSFGDGILFVSSQAKDLVNNNSSVDINNIPYTDVFQGTLVDEMIKNKKSFSSTINGLYHDGPLAFNPSKTQAYLTRVEHKKGAKGFTNKAKLYVFDKKGTTWQESSAFAYNNDAYSTGHAACSADGQLLFFASDMPGGFGGKDIYVCRKSGKLWGEPENLGAEINTKADEEYPYMREDGILFFSSQGHSGFGGYDIFSAYFFNAKWLFKKNEGQPLNSSSDDFGIFFTNALNGYFSSNRPGGVGNDDIYKFSFSSSGISVSGRLLLTESLKDPARYTLVYLMDERGKRIDSTHTDKYGFFEFKNLYGEKSFMVSIEPEDIEMKGKARYYIANDNNEIVRTSQEINKDRFIFKNLPLEKSVLQEIHSDEDLTLSGILTYSHSSQYIRNIKINLINSYGDVVQSAHTNELGYFVFKNLPADQSYLVEIPEESVRLPFGTVVTLSDKNGKKLKHFVAGQDVFRFKLLPPEKYTLSELEVDENIVMDNSGCFQNQGQLTPVAGKKIYLVDAKNKRVDSCLTNSQGFFKFKNIDPDKYYMAYFETEDQTLKRKSGYYLRGTDGKMVRTAYLSQGNRHTFRSVPSDSASLQSMRIGEKLTLAGKLRYGDKGDIPLENIRVRLLDAKGKIIDTIAANKMGCFIFRNLDPEKTYLLDMDEQDIKLPANTRVIMAAFDGKIIKTFYVGKDKFEYKILPVEKNLMPDLIISDSDLAIILTGYIFGENKKPLKNVTLTLRDTKGKIVEVIKTQPDGSFTFKSLKEELADLIELTTDTSDAVFYIADNKARIYKRIAILKGRFEYKLLDVDRAWMGVFDVDDPWLEVTRMAKPSDIVTIIENIYYGTNDFKFDSTGQKRLDKAIYALKANVNLVLEVGSHTDSRANDQYNLDLSNKRANYAVDYIVSRGIDKSRITGIGYGEKKLLNRCNNSTRCPDEEHAKNRRTEFKLSFKGTTTHQ